MMDSGNMGMGMSAKKPKQKECSTLKGHPPHCFMDTKNKGKDATKRGTPPKSS